MASNQEAVLAKQQTMIANQQAMIANQQVITSNPEVIEQVKEVSSIVSSTFKSVEGITQAITEYSKHRGAFKANEFHRLLLEKTTNARTSVEVAMDKVHQTNIPDWTNSDAYNEFTKNLTGAVKELDEATNILKDLIDKGSNFLPLSNNLFDALNNLTLLQEASLLHLIFFVIIIFSIINILSALFGNEIIRYFNLENRFPKLSLFFKARSIFQRYYLIWSILILFTVCIAGIFINLLLFTVK